MDNRRETKRYIAAVAAEIEVHGEAHEGETHDISSGGISAVFSHVFTDGEVIDLTLILTQDGIEDPTEDPFETPAKVMWSATTDSGGTMVGLRFTKLEGEQDAHLKRFLLALED